MAEEPKRPEFRWCRKLGGFLDKALCFDRALVGVSLVVFQKQ